MNAQALSDFATSIQVVPLIAMAISMAGRFLMYLEEQDAESGNPVSAMLVNFYAPFKPVGKFTAPLFFLALVYCVLFLSIINGSIAWIAFQATSFLLSRVLRPLSTSKIVAVTGLSGVFAYVSGAVAVVAHYL